MTGLSQPFCPISQYRITVGDKVISPTLFYIPFTHIVAQQRFAMGRTYDNATTVSHLLCTRSHKKRNGARMHTRPYSIGTKASQQFEYLLVGFCTNHTFSIPFFECFVTPWTYAPILIIKENASIFNRWALQRSEVGINSQTSFTLRFYISPPYPR